MSKKSKKLTDKKLVDTANHLLTSEGVAELDEALEQAPEPKVIKSEPTKSDLIRAMYEQGESISAIARKLNAHYSFVYQVCKKYADVVDEGMFSTHQDKGPTRADEMRKLWDEGLNIGDIAKKLNANYSYVWSVVDAYRRKQEVEAKLARTVDALESKSSK